MICHDIKCVVFPNLGKNVSDAQKKKKLRSKTEKILNLEQVIGHFILTQLDIKTQWRAKIPGPDWHAVTALLTHLMQICEWGQENV